MRPLPSRVRHLQVPRRDDFILQRELPILSVGVSHMRVGGLYGQLRRHGRRERIAQVESWLAFRGEGKGTLKRTAAVERGLGQEAGYVTVSRYGDAARSGGCPVLVCEIETDGNILLVGVCNRNPRVEWTVDERGDTPGLNQSGRLDPRFGHQDSILTKAEYRQPHRPGIAPAGLQSPVPDGNVGRRT